MTTSRIIYGNSLEVLKSLPDNSVDSIVTDPPYELGFMGKGWDSTGIANSIPFWKECLRVLKPGGALLSFGGTRTYHRMACAIEDAGFEVRDSIHWNYGSGFPKSHNISKGIDKMKGFKREVVGTGISGKIAIWQEQGGMGNFDITAPATPEAQQWDGWGTALKPAHEPIVMARKPLSESTVAKNVLKWGTGGINIDGCRVGSETISTHNAPKGTFAGGELDRGSDTDLYKNHEGRFPANTLLTHHVDCDWDGACESPWECVPGCPVRLLDNQSGNSKSGKSEMPIPKGHAFASEKYGNNNFSNGASVRGHSDAGGASRFFHQSEWSELDNLVPFIYLPKAGKKERNAGLEGLPEKSIGPKGHGLARTCDVCGVPQMTGCKCPDGTFSNPTKTNFHPTVKPVALMRYLVRLVTPVGGTVLDPFMGSGTTGVAAILEGFNVIGIEMTEEYLPIINGRIAHAKTLVLKNDADVHKVIPVVKKTVREPSKTN